MTINEIIVVIGMIAFLCYGLILRNKTTSAKVNIPLTDKDQFMLEIMQKIQKDQAQLTEQVSSIQELRLEFKNIEDKMTEIEKQVSNTENFNLNLQKSIEQLYNDKTLERKLKNQSSLAFSKTQDDLHYFENLFITVGDTHSIKKKPRFNKTNTTNTTNTFRKLNQTEEILA
ncbi:hypothetical protein MKX99_21840 [Bacillus sp. FSL R9-9863]|uniref:hypothetical protein n=1 Tax=Bacillus sp. FSL R9-9863 TaxID=2921693 RepID=UPI0030F5EE26